MPFVVRWPGRIAANTTTDHISAFWDVLPTLADVTGVTPPENLDGLSMLPTLTGREGDQQQHPHLYWEFHERGGRQAVRKGNWKAVRYDMGANPDAPIELFDLSTDLGETTNVADDHPDIVAEMARLMEESREPSTLFNFGR